MHGRLRHTLLGRWSAIVSRHPWWVLGGAVALAVAAAAVTIPLIGFQSNRNDLISDQLEWNQRFLQWRAEFPSLADLYVVIDTYNQQGESDPRTDAKAQQLVSKLGPALEKTEAVKHAVWGYQRGGAGVNPRAIRIQSMPEFKQTLGKLADASTLLDHSSPSGFIGGVIQRFTGSAQGRSTDERARMLDQLLGLVQGFTKRFKIPAAQRVDLGESAGSALGGGFSYLRTENERLLIIRLTPAEQAGALSSFGQSISTIRGVLDDYAQNYPNLEFGLTGVKAVETDETASAVRGSTLASVLATVLIVALLIAAFHSIRVPLMLMVSLGIAIAWTFGFLTLAVGHLQVISVVFTVILLGLGVAFGIHLISRYEMIRHRHPDTEEGFAAALRDTLEVVGPGLFTGAVTTSVAFCTTMLTDFRGVAEMGEIAAAGIMLCLLAMVSVFPALLRLFKRGHDQMIRMEHRHFHIFEESWAMPFVRHPRMTAGLCLGLGLAALIYGLGIGFNYNLLALMPPGARSVRWQRRLIERGDASVYQGVSVVDNMNQARDLTRRFRQLETVESVGGVGRLMPANNQAKIKLLKQTRQRLEPQLSEVVSSAGEGQRGQREKEADGPRGEGVQGKRRRGAEGQSGGQSGGQNGGRSVRGSGGQRGGQRGGQTNVLDQLAGLGSLLKLAGQGVDPSLKPKIEQLGREIDKTLSASDSLTAEQRRERLEALKRDYQRWRHQSAKRISQALDIGPLELSDLPAPVIRPYVGHAVSSFKAANTSKDARINPEADPAAGAGASGKARASNSRRLMLEINPKVPKGIGDPLDPRFLGQFVKELESVDPGVTGAMVQIYYSGQLIQRSYVLAGLYALIAVFLLVWLDFRSLSDAILCLLPVAVGFACTFALLRLMAMAINAANIIVLPLMFGIGVDYGVHILHRYRQDPTSQPPGLTAGTGKGIALTSYTTIIGFASLTVASHRGIRSLGLTLALGITMTLLACLTLMPARLQLRTEETRKAPRSG